jgi:ABC-type multidrug transport system ATPase subunit
MERVRWSAKSTATRIFLTLLKPTEGAASVAGLEVTQSVAPESRIVYVDNEHCKSGCAHAR